MNAWLIERVNVIRPGCVTGECLGECCGALKWTTPDLAIRYARKEDAEAAVRTYRLRDAVAVEHEWGDLDKCKCRKCSAPARPDGYCDACYPYDRACDEAKRAAESGAEPAASSGDIGALYERTAWGGGSR